MSFLAKALVYSPIAIDNISFAMLSSTSLADTLSLSFSATNLSDQSEVSTPLNIMICVTGAGYQYYIMATSVWDSLNSIHVFDADHSNPIIVNHLPESEREISYGGQHESLNDSGQISLVEFTGRTMIYGRDTTYEVSVTPEFVDRHQIYNVQATVNDSVQNSKTFKCQATVNP